MSTNQGKLEVVKQEKARVNIDILGISELKWIGMGEFDSDDQEMSPSSGKSTVLQTDTKSSRMKTRNALRRYVPCDGNALISVIISTLKMTKFF